MKQIDHNFLGPRKLLFNKEHLTSGYLSGLGIVAALALGLYATLVAEINSQGRYATMINLADRQRALSQTVALYVLRSTGSADPAQLRAWRETIAAALGRMERVHRAMLKGDAKLGFPDKPLPEITALYRDSPGGLGPAMEKFFASVHALLALPAGTPFDARSPEVAYVLAAAPGDLLGGLERGVSIYQEASQHRLAVLRTLTTVVLVVILLVMLGEGMLIFRPLILEILRDGRELADAHERLDAVINTVAEAIITADARNRIISANAEAEHIWKAGPGELAGHKLNGLVLTGRDLPSDEWRAQFLGRRHVETVGVRRDGGAFPLSLTLGETRSGGADAAGPRIFTLSGRDISAQVEAARQLAAARDAALESARAKSQFVASMSHEIRTPMNGVIGMSDLLLATPLTPEQRDYVETIRVSGDSMLRIVGDILDFSKVEAGRMTLESIDFDLRYLVEGVGDLLAGQAVQKQIELIVFIEPDVPTLLRGDPSRLRQVLLNLLGNALKFTKAGEAVVRVSTERATDTHAELRFVVQDTGIGIDAAARARLFQAYSQADASTSRRFGGTGLGLTLSRQLVELMGGRIDLTSEPGRGSTFWFTVPFERQPALGPDDPAAAEQKQLLLRRKRLAGVRVLIVDDNATLREFFAHRLSAWGMVADSVGDGPGALSRLRQQAQAGSPYDLAILDLNLGSMDGYTLAWAIHSQPLLAATRLVLMTALGLATDLKSFRQVGLNASITKPLKRDTVLDTLAQVIVGEDHTAETPDADRAAPAAAALLAAPSVAAGTGTETAPAAPAAGSAGVVLVADDDATNRKLAVRQLEKLGYEAFAAENGVEALAALDQRRFDAVLLDMQMPELDGCETAMRIRQRESAAAGGRRLPLIAMTASTEAEDYNECLAAGMDGYLSKPVRQDDLGRMLAHWVRNGRE